MYTAIQNFEFQQDVYFMKEIDTLIQLFLLSTVLIEESR